MMDISDIKNVASRKRINADAENLREKVSRETAKIIKLKVAQDTAYWDLKEKLQQVENNHEKLQQNMLEVQMQHETISCQYQEEIRLRPDTLNKLSSTREICDVLEDYSSRLKDTLSRCKTDQIALCEAYQRSTQLVREIKTEQVEMGEKNRSLVEGLEEKVKLLTEHQNQLLQIFTAAKQQADSENADIRNKLTLATAHKDELLVIQNDLNRKLDQCKFDIEKKEEINANLESNIQKLMQDFNSQAAEAREVFEKQDKEIKEINEEKASLKEALTYQEQFTKTLCEQNEALQEKIAVLGDEHIASVKKSDELKLQIEEASSLNQGLRHNITTLTQENQCLRKEIQDTKEIVSTLEQEMRNLKTDCSKLEVENAELKDELNKTLEESTNRATEIEKLTSIRISFEDKVSELEDAIEKHKKFSEEKNKELNDVLENKNKEIDSKASTINQLMSQIKTDTDLRTKLEVALQKIKKEIEIENDATREKERKMTNTIGQLETAIREKDIEVSKQISIILEIRNEKERLQEKIQNLQNTIDNIQKELSHPLPRNDAATRVQPELDDNAVMLTPSHKKTQLMSPSSPVLPKPTEFAIPRTQEAKMDDMLFSLFSDSSVDGDSLDASEVNRRFNALARGERLSPAPLSALRRRRSGTAARAPSAPTDGTANVGENYKNEMPLQLPQLSQLSLSQMKNLKNRERSFFKNKRLDSKLKKAK